MKQTKLKLTIILLITSICIFSQSLVWKSSDKSISINYNQNWRFTQPDDVLIVKFMPSDEYPDGKFTQISLTVSKIRPRAETLTKIRKYIYGYVSNFENGKLISCENTKENNRYALVTTISLTRNSIPFMYKSYIFYSGKMHYTLMLICRNVDFNRNEILLKEMYKTLKIK